MDIFDDIQPGSDGLSEVSTHAGFPNPAAARDHRKPTLSLDTLLVTQPNSTYYFRLQGSNWEEQGVFEGDIAIVDRALPVQPDDLVVAWPDGEFVLVRAKRLIIGSPWGVVTAIIHQYRGKRHD
jgi:SOS-response transcriptional repressor LexA